MGGTLYFGSRFHIVARIPGDSVNTLLRWCLNARGSNHPHSARWWGRDLVAQRNGHAGVDVVPRRPGGFPCPERCTGESGPSISKKLRNSHAPRVKLMTPSLLRTLPGQPSPCSFAPRALFPGNALSFKVLRIWEEVMDYISFLGEKSCVRVAITPSKMETKQNKKPGKKAPR